MASRRADEPQELQKPLQVNVLQHLPRRRRPRPTPTRRDTSPTPRRASRGPTSGARKARWRFRAGNRDAPTTSRSRVAFPDTNKEGKADFGISIRISLIGANSTRSQSERGLRPLWLRATFPQRVLFSSSFSRTHHHPRASRPAMVYEDHRRTARV